MFEASETLPVFVVGAAPATVEDIVAVAEGRMTVELSTAPEFVAAIQAGEAFVDKLVAENAVVYGITTGYGDSCTTGVPEDYVQTLPLHLLRYHGCGAGRYLDRTEARATMFVRLVSLSQQYSGVSQALLDRLAALINADVWPLIPAEGSVGASGDLTPLSYVAALLVGERDAMHKGVQRPAAEILAELGLAPLTLRPKEGLAIMNGTAVMTGLAALGFARADYLARLSCRVTALNVLAMRGNAGHFDATLFAAKPHPGQAVAARLIRTDLGQAALRHAENRLQDRYSLRCAPHVIGVLMDALPMMRQMIETEANSANDNPLFDVPNGRVLHGGHFYGGHICFVADGLKTLVANLADLMDRQLALLVDRKFNNDLPANLSGATGPGSAINHGFKAVQISVSAFTAEALKQTMPASVFSRSTECHNQDKVSMGTIAARDALRVIELTEQVVACCLMAAIQGVRLRARTETVPLSDELAAFVEAAGADFPLVEEDRMMEFEIRAFVARIGGRAFEVAA